MITVFVPGPLRGHTGGRDTVEVRFSGAATLRDLLAELWRLHPGLRDRVLTETGEIRRHVNVFVGAERSALDAPVGDGAEISILPAVSGG